MCKLAGWILIVTSAFSQAAPREVIAGTGKAGYSGDGGPAIKAQLNNPFGVIQLPDGTIYFCDTGNHVIRRIDAQGIISTVAGNGSAGYSGDGGPALEAQLHEPYEVRINATGDLIFVERLNHCLRKVDAKTGLISTVAGDGEAGFRGDGGPATAARFREPHSVQLDSAGHLYVCDIKNHRVRRIDGTSGIITTLAGTGEKKMPAGRSEINGSPLAGPRALDFSSDGMLWLALREGNAIYRLDLKRNAMVPMLTSDLHGPKGIAAGTDGRIYIADTEAHRVTYFDANDSPAQAQVLLGDGKKGTLARPHGVFVTEDDRVLIGDSENHQIVQVRATGSASD